MPTQFELLSTFVMLSAFLMTGRLLLSIFPIDSTGVNRYEQLDGLRALLAFGVIVFHNFGLYYLTYRGYFYLEWLTWVAEMSGRWTVPMFFAITGFLFTRQFLQIKDHRDSRFLPFLVNRVIRLFPMNFVLAVVLSVLYYLSGHFSVSMNTFIDIAGFRFINFPRFSETIATWELLPREIVWSLHSEWIFYLSVPIMFPAFNKRGLVWLVLSVILLVIFTDFTTYVVHWNYDHPLLAWAFIPGVIVGVIDNYRQSYKPLSHPVIGFYAIICVLFAEYLGQLKYKIPANAFFLSVILSSNTLTKVLSNKTLKSLGETTYSLYLMHSLVQYANSKWFFTIPIAHRFPQWVWLVVSFVTVVVTVFVSRVTYQYVEKPCIKFGKSLQFRFQK